MRYQPRRFPLLCRLLGCTHGIDFCLCRPCPHRCDRCGLDCNGEPA